MKACIRDYIGKFANTYFRTLRVPFAPGREILIKFILTCIRLSNSVTTTPAWVAQSVERVTLNLKVAGSSPASGSIPEFSQGTLNTFLVL